MIRWLALAALCTSANGWAEETVAQIEGVARDGKIGAVVVSDDGRHLYVQGLHWPDGVAGARVQVTGTIHEQRYAPEAEVGPNGEVSQGVMPGSALDTVIVASSWKLEGAGEGLEPGPWRISYADGSGNATRLWRAPDEVVIHWAYDPVRPEQSSSGSYSGGQPAKGTVSTEQATVLWVEIRRLQVHTPSHVDHRSMGTGQLKVTTVAGDARVLLGAAAATGLTKRLAALRAR